MEEHKILLIEHDRIRAYRDATFTEPESGELKKLRSGAIIPLSLLHIHTLKLPGHLSEDELRVQVEIRMFEEGNLNPDEEYTIDFIRHVITEEASILVEVFALSSEKASEYFAESLQICDAIDTLVPAFLVYGSIYRNLPAKNDLFVYWGEEEAFAAIYQNGHYIAQRSIETLTTIAVEVGLELSKLKTFLETKGLIEEHYLPEELNKFILLQDRIAKNVERIVHMINHKRGLFGLHGIDTLYLDFEGKNIPGLSGAFHAYGISSIAVAPLHHINVQPSLIHDALCADYFLSPLAFNLSPFTRKAAWYRRESGRFLGLIGAALFLVLSMSLGLGWMVSEKTTQNEELTARIETLRQQTASLAASLKSNKEKLKEAELKNRTTREEISLYRGSEDTADLIRSMHGKRQSFLADTTAELGRYRLGARMMEQNGSKEMSIHVIADYRKRDDIAKLMNGLYDRGYQNVTTEEIKLDDERYNSLVKVIR